MYRLKFTVTNIECSACVRMIDLLLKKLVGVRQVDTDEATGVVLVTADQPIEFTAVRDGLAAKGYRVSGEQAI